MKLIHDGYRGMSLLVEMNFDRFLMTGILAFALAGAALFGQVF